MTALTILFLMALLNGSTTDWAAGWSFGGRRFVSCMVLLAPGLALTIEALAIRISRQRVVRLAQRLAD